MLTALVLAQAIQHTNPALSKETARQYASYVLTASKKHSLDPWIFQSIISRETRWQSVLVRREADGSCSVGLGQINGRCTEAVMAPLRDPRVNIFRMGTFLAHLRSTCRTDCQDLGWLRRYNPGSAAYLAAIQEAVRTHHAQDGQSAVLRVPAQVPAPRVLRHAPHRAGRDCGLDAGTDHP